MVSCGTLSVSLMVVEESWPTLLSNVALVHRGLQHLKVPPQHFSQVEVWGLMYKDLRGFPTETLRTLKPRCPPTHINIRKYESVGTHESKHIFFVHPNQRGIERTSRSIRLLPVHAPI